MKLTGKFFQREEEYVGFKVFQMVVIKCSVFWEKVPCCPLKVSQRLGAICRSKKNSVCCLLHPDFCWLTLQP